MLTKKIFDFSGHLSSGSVQGLSFQINFGTISVNSVTRKELAEPLGFRDGDGDNGCSKHSFVTSFKKEEWDQAVARDLGS